MANLGSIGVVTVTYNSDQVIDRFMRSVLQQDYIDLRIYIVDSGSSDRTLECLAPYQGNRVVLIASDKNIGVAAGNNRGIEAALADGCQAVLLINNDTEFGPTLVGDLAEGLQQYACDMIAPKILYFDDPQRIWCAGGGFQALKGYAGHHYGSGERDNGQHDEPRKIEHAPTCCLLVRKQVFEQIGTMDERYFVYIDDADFTFRAMKAGLTMWYLPSTSLLHKVSALTGGAQSDFNVRFCTRNHIYFMLKHLGLWKSSILLPAYQLHLFGKLVSRQIDMRGFFLRERAFVEGLRAWRYSVTPQSPATVRTVT